MEIHSQMMSDKLEELRKKGLEKRERDAEARDDAESGRVLAAMADGKRGTSSWGWAADPMWFALFGIAALLFALYTAFNYVILHSDLRTHRAEVRFDASLVVLEISLSLIALVVLARLVVKSAIAREDAWKSRLPFALVDHYYALGSSSHVTLTLVFRAEMPSAEDVEVFAEGASGAFRIRPAARDSRCLRLELDSHRGADSARQRWRAFHVLVDQLLVPLHKRFPLESVSAS
jgi:hypothetical protein